MACRFNRAVVAAGLLAPALIMAAPSLAALSAVERLDIIERKLESRGLVDLSNRIVQLQQELQKLRGEMEVQAHRLQDIQRKQREQYLDIDRRLQQLESAPAAALQPGALPPAAAPGATAPAAALAPAAPAGAAADRPVAVRPPVEPVPGSIEQLGEQAEYDAALALLRDGNYPEAGQAFTKFLANHPASSYADNANYWLGEAYYVTRSFDRAQSTFENLVATFPQSTKVPGSRLKIAYILYEKQDWEAARKALTELVSAYPESTVARQANDRLQRMKAEGH